MSAWMDVAQLTDTKTLGGRLVAYSAPGLPFLLYVGLEVAFVPPVLGVPRRARVRSIKPLGLDGGVVDFEGVEDIEVSKALVGCHCLIRRTDLPEGASECCPQTNEWKGFCVFDAGTGLVGTVTGVRKMPSQKLLVVEQSTQTQVHDVTYSSDNHLVLVPLVESIIVKVDEDARRIDVDLPAGLLDL